MNKLCECGCGKEVRLPHHRFIYNHHSRGQSYWLRQQSSPLCACGCGERIKSAENKYIYEHQNRNKKRSEEARIRMSLAKGGSGVLPQVNLCACGCGEYTKPGNRYICGHNNRGKSWRLSDEARRHQSLARGGVGTVRNLEPQLCECGCGDFANPGYRFVKNHYGAYLKEHPRTISLEERKRRSEALKGRIMPEGFGERCNQHRKGKELPEQWKRNISNSLKGRKFSEEHLRKLRVASTAEKNYNWKGGISAEPYSIIWNDSKFKNDLKFSRDGGRCWGINCSGACVDQRLFLHHIDYDKMNCHPMNLITVCNSCNVKANHNRGYWTNEYMLLMLGRFGDEATMCWGLTLTNTPAN